MKKTIPVSILVLLFIFTFKSSIYHPDITVGNDLLWHLEYGKRIASDGVIPTVDWLSWTFSGQPYQITQWLGETLLALPFMLGGSTLLNLLLAVTVCAIFIFAWLCAHTYIQNSFTALLVAIFSCHQVIAVNARPQIFGFVLFAALVWVMSVWFERQKKWALASMPVIMMLWANCHGSFIVGVLYIAALGGGAWISSYHSTGWKFVQSLKQHSPLAIASFASIFATLVNPYGYGAYLYVLSISQLQTTKSGMITEWQATSLSTANGQSFILVTAATMVAILLSRKNLGIQGIIGFMGTIYFGLSADRQTFFATIAMIPFFATAISDSALAEMFDKQGAPKTSILVATISLTCFALTWVALHELSQNFIKTQYERLYPVAAIKWLDENKIEGKLFNHMESGGYIESTGRKAFFDGRLDLYGDQFAIGALDATMGKNGWDNYLDEHKPDLFILKNDALLIYLLNTVKGYPTIYHDEFHTVIKKPSSTH